MKEIQLINSMTAQYNPGTHKLLTLQVDEESLLKNIDDFLATATVEIEKNKLNIVGLSTHTFDGGGFTVAICLMESHICIHTWPEFKQLTLDIYLCNYLRDNTEKVEGLSQVFKAYFQSKVVKEITVNR
ncbi:S-adenosylmethionine decarboxylase family protein [Sphingobacterium bambusae]|uniref:S-adenosylmethionine decarboxylase family protein n=1 Tax=Sphingobacterium bambusae TaxID=662858 RepID=UPI0036D377D9